VSEAAPRERELKFTPGPSFRMPTFDDARDGCTADETGTVRLQAAYFDTADLRLARSGASLRFRNDEGWTVKLPVSSDVALVRSELHLGGEPGDPPEAAVDLVQAIVRRESLALVARLNTVRHRVVLRDADGTQLAELVDDEVSVLEGARLTARFRELEVEFADDAPSELVDSIADRLRAAGAGEPEQIPKIVRALGPRALDPPELPAPAKLDFASTPLEALRAAVTRSTARLVSHDPGVRTGEDAEAVHQARVATRRLRSDLKTFRNVVDPAWDAALRDELKWLGQLLGAVRDDDVLLERLEGRLGKLPATDAGAGKRLLEALREHRTRARTELLDAMRSERYVALLDRLVAAARAIPSSGDGAELDLELSDLVRKPWKRLRDGVRDLGDDPPDPELHAVRIRAKRCRYAAEAVAPAIGKAAKRFAAAVEGVQEILGEHQDAIVAGRWLRAHVVEGSGGRVDSAFVAGELAALEDIAAERSRAEWPKAWKRAKRKKLRGWM
jgi:CHAD domain-containing protein